LTEEINEILNSARASAEAMSHQLLSDARNESAKIVENAKKRMELERRFQHPYPQPHPVAGG
jgi:F0F1-type ATP synthase membrane subunit b/b'